VPDLAQTLLALAESGEALIRDGRLAQAIVADQQANGGLLTATDLAQFDVRQPDPIRITYRDYTVLLPPLASVGGVLTAFTLKLLAGFAIQKLEHGSARHLQLLYEVMAATTRAREVWDKQQDAMPIADFLHDEFIGRYPVEALSFRHGSSFGLLQGSGNLLAILLEVPFLSLAPFLETSGLVNHQHLMLLLDFYLHGLKHCEELRNRFIHPLHIIVHHEAFVDWW
jgi:hypothetical protein